MQLLSLVCAFSFVFVIVLATVLAARPSHHLEPQQAAIGQRLGDVQ